MDSLDRSGVLTSRAGEVALVRPKDLSDDYDQVADEMPSNWELLHHLIRVLDSEGIAAAGALLAAALSRPDGAYTADLVTELAPVVPDRRAQRLGPRRPGLQHAGHHLARNPDGGPSGSG